MPDWLTLAEVVAAVAILCLVLPLLVLIGRRRWLSTRGRVFDCSLREPGSAEAGWMLGTARYRDDVFEWYRVYSLSFRPRLSLQRHQTQVAQVRSPRQAEVSVLSAGELVAELAGSHAGTALAMDRDNMTAFHSWTEAGPPGLGLGAEYPAR